MEYVAMPTLFYGEGDTGTYEHIGDEVDRWLREITDEAEANPNTEVSGSMSVAFSSVEVLLSDPEDSEDFAADHDAELWSSPGDDDVAFLVYPDTPFDLFEGKFGVVYTPEGIWTGYLDIKGGGRLINDGQSKESLWRLFQDGLADELENGYEGYYNDAVTGSVDTSYDVELL